MGNERATNILFKAVFDDEFFFDIFNGISTQN